jgi:3-oxoadipate enol-lactonase
VVFLHGYPLNHEMWMPQLAALSDSRHIALLDLPGYGLARDRAAPDSLMGIADSVHETVVERFARPVVVVGHSLGGYVALEWYLRHPDQFRGLVLTNTRSEPDSPEAREKRVATIKRLEDPSQTLDVDEVVRGLLAGATWLGGGPLVENVRAMVREAPRESVRATLKAIADRPDLTPILQTIRVPTLVIWGEEDHLIPPSQTQAMVARIQGATGAAIPAAGHLPSLEAPKSFLTALGPFLDRLGLV